MKSEVIHTQKEKSWMISFVHGIAFLKSQMQERQPLLLLKKTRLNSQHSCLRGSQPPVTRDAALLWL